MEDSLVIEWLGTNAFRFHYNGRILLLDPYVTRSRIKICDKEIIAGYIPRADYIFIGHSHWDHLADAAELSRQTNAVIVGSQTTLNICRAQGVPEDRLRLFSAGDSLDFGDFQVDVYASVHMQPMRFPGIYESVPEKIETIEDFLEGGTFALRFQFGSLKILNVGSANFLKKELDGIKCDYLLAGIAGRSDVYMKELIESVSPQVVIPTHFDDLETPLEDNNIRIDVEAFKQEVLELFPDIKLKVPIPLEEIKI